MSTGAQCSPSQLIAGLVEAGKPDDSLDYNNWIQNAAQLSCFFFNAGRFPEAHHILNAADKMLELGKVRSCDHGCPARSAGRGLCLCSHASARWRHTKTWSC